MAIFTLPRMNSLSAAGQAQIRDFKNERSKRAFEKQEAGQADPGLQERSKWLKSKKWLGSRF